MTVIVFWACVFHVWSLVSTQTALSFKSSPLRNSQYYVITHEARHFGTCHSLPAVLNCKENRLRGCQISLHKLNPTWQPHWSYFNQHNPKTPKPKCICCPVCCQSIYIYVFVFLQCITYRRWNDCDIIPQRFTIVRRNIVTVELQHTWQTRARASYSIITQAWEQHRDCSLKHNYGSMMITSEVTTCSIFNRLCRLWPLRSVITQVANAT